MAFAFVLGCFLLAGSWPGVWPCLQCDPVVRYMHEDFLSSVPGITVSDQIALEEVIEDGYAKYHETSASFRGVIDPATLYRVRTEYQNEFKRFWKESTSDLGLVWDMVSIVETGNRILQKHLGIFIAKDLCPNKCGLLYERVMNCTSCQYGLFACQTGNPPQDCGEFNLEADEGEAVVLDCFLPWHILVIGQTEYRYSWQPEEKNLSRDGEYEVLVMTEQSKIVLNQLTTSEEGLYRCLLQDQKGTLLSRMYFKLKVNPLPSTTPRQIAKMPSLPLGFDATPHPHKSSFIIILIFLTVLSITGCLVIIMYLRLTMKRQKEESDSRKGGEHGENTELMTVTE